MSVGERERERERESGSGRGEKTKCAIERNGREKELNRQGEDIVVMDDDGEVGCIVELIIT